MAEAAPSEVQDAAAPARRELRVLAGRNAGARTALEAGRWTEVGYAFSSDVVLRDPGARGVRLRLRPTEDAADLDLLEGAVELLGHPIAAPATAILPGYVPLFLGDCAIALGAPDGTRWPEADRLVRAARPPADEPLAEAEDGGALQPSGLPPWRLISPVASALPRLAPAAPVVGGAVAAVAAVLLGWTAVAGWLNRTPTADRAAALLQADGFRGLQVRSGGEGLVIEGVLGRGAELARLQADVARRRWPALVRVRTNDSLVQNVSDILRTNGYEAEVHALGPGILSAAVHGGDPARLDVIRAKTLHEVAGLRQLVINGAQNGDSSLLVAGDPNKRVVSVVGGEDGYVQTRDGSRYFVGAVLPDGHTVTGIEGQTVTVEKDGRTTNLAF